MVGCVHKTLAAIAEEKIGGSELPGFVLKVIQVLLYVLLIVSAHMQGIDPIVIMVKDGLFNGTPDEKEESARVIILLVRLSPVQVSKGLTHKCIHIIKSVAVLLLCPL